MQFEPKLLKVPLKLALAFDSAIVCETAVSRFLFRQSRKLCKKLVVFMQEFVFATEYWWILPVRVVKPVNR